MRKDRAAAPPPRILKIVEAYHSGDRDRNRHDAMELLRRNKTVQQYTVAITGASEMAIGLNMKQAVESGAISDEQLRDSLAITGLIIEDLIKYVVIGDKETSDD